MASLLSPETREATLAALPTTDLDLLVIGGGITGAGIARDAALRGVSVALIERTDFAAGTSSRSSKLIHGGVRYWVKRERFAIDLTVGRRRGDPANSPFVTIGIALQDM